MGADEGGLERQNGRRPDQDRPAEYAAGREGSRDRRDLGRRDRGGAISLLWFVGRIQRWAAATGVGRSAYSGSWRGSNGRQALVEGSAADASTAAWSSASVRPRRA